ncbi:DUF2946 domain-containing protein [Methylophilus aquaticus]|uniref:DUF2946 domain-containing protein n=1 Tax=Methylophilus aquaticus TaxID=1971610 RepID=A0ABT9JTA8_9PROT|nr:DUF2946 domain-containing protein [Methylophilus aquaticus]MDP8567371.1 DUF2946 domain-containing protein [Methylophilus aquaticus]
MRNVKTQRWIARLAMMAMLLVSLVPTLSLAFPMQSGKSFVQEVCSTQGSKLVIQVITTQGKQLSTLIDYKPSQKPVSLSHHLNHCPFCHMAIDDVVQPSYSPAYILFQQAQADIALSEYQAPVVSYFYPSAHTTRAPPLTSSPV